MRTMTLSASRVLNCDKATPPPASHPRIQCVRFLELSSGALESIIAIDSVYWAAMGSQKAVGNAYARRAFARDLRGRTFVSQR